MSQEGIEQQSVAFHNRARNAFFSLYQEFRFAISSVDRQGAENVFQQFQNRYASQLHLQLNGIALELLGRTDPSCDHSTLNQLFNQYIEEYVKEFLQKAKSL